jgi:hypothetical protein
MVLGVAGEVFAEQFDGKLLELLCTQCECAVLVEVLHQCHHLLGRGFDANKFERFLQLFQVELPIAIGVKLRKGAGRPLDQLLHVRGCANPGASELA